MQFHYPVTSLQVQAFQIVTANKNDRSVQPKLGNPKQLKHLCAGTIESLGLLDFK
jgi:hypothetical protein